MTIHLRLYTRFGSRRRVNHPGEWVVGVMTAHPAWLQSQYEQNRAGSVIVGRAKARVHESLS